MLTRENWRWFIDHPVVEWSIFGLGVILLLISPIVGAIPGPGGIIVAGIGLALILKTSMWARRYYVKFKRKRPKLGRWTDLALRRRSARRRERLRKEREGRAAEGGSNPVAIGQAPVQPAGGAPIETPPETAPDLPNEEGRSD